MHDFSELASQAVRSSLNSFSNADKSYKDQLQKTGATHLVKGLQRIQLQRAILVTGLFSLYDAELQKRLSCSNGFKECKRILIIGNQTKLHDEFNCYVLAINVLKHGKGRSYNQLIENFETLPFKIKKPNQDFFFEGDASEISTLIEVDDDFVLGCTNIVCKISNYLKNRNQ